MLIALERALPHCRIHAQVAMGALLKAPTNPLRKSRHSDRNAFSQKIVDFVAQDRATGAILALIEVDDYSHNAARDRARDAMTSYMLVIEPCALADLSNPASRRCIRQCHHC
ncbi:DUF2726 domain-containing protein (plasmid) [Novosphingobium resinovorum]|uniref:DUF2726 domain-containing protein n=1 Tax=Novosphingobium sp. HR1a TaxID=1395637 RepID=UPI0020065221|nr:MULTISPECIES: DUF2726 domain-containing protein [Novosphingobium]WJM30032.1 DUF2726 domain-containing protein [Novosphingobium resinovorum]